MNTRNSILRLFFLIALAISSVGSLSACVSKSASSHLASPVSQSTNAIAISRTIAQSARVPVDLPTGKILEIESLSTPVGLNGALTPEEVQTLTAYLKIHRAELGAPLKPKPLFKSREKDAFDLDFVTQSNAGQRIFIRFKQVNRRFVGTNTYTIPVVGADLIVVLESGFITHVMSHLVPPPSMLLGFHSSGIKLDFSLEEVGMLMDAIKTNLDQRESFVANVARYAQSSGSTNPFPEILNRDVATQKAMLTKLLASFGDVSTARLLIEAALHQQLSYVRYGKGSWMYQLTRWFDMPVQFDVEQPTSNGGSYHAKNLRELRTRVSAAQPFDSPFFPAGKKTPDGPSGERAAERLDVAGKYFSDYFGWKSFTQKDAELPYEVHGAVRFISYRENAAWNTAFQKFIVGEGGPILAGLDSSLSVLGHEYTHALVQHTSGLTYVGESGALNEHFADIEGATIVATTTDAPFSYDMGSDTLTDATKAERLKLIPLISADRYKFTDDQKQKYSLLRPSMRNFWAPKLSLGAQFETVDEYRKEFGESCQPSSTNDNCGVHAASGILNRAAALIINDLGLEQTRSLFFNTVVYRLTASSNFRDYLTQLMQECHETAAIKDHCDVIEKHFNSVGISLAEVSRGPVTAGPAASTAQHIVEQSVLSSPEVMMCGWVDSNSADRWKIIDGKYNTSILRRNYPIKTAGNVAPVGDLSCACVKGTVTQSTDVHENVFSTFANVSLFKDRGDHCAKDPLLVPLQPVKIAVPVLLPKKYCGWISISPTKSVTIIDNRFNAELIPNRTQGDFSSIYTQECACISGDVEYKEDQNGRSTNTVTQLVPNSVEPRQMDKCFDIRWK